MNSSTALSEVETLRVQARRYAVERAAKEDRKAERIAIDSYRKAIRSLDGQDLAPVRGKGHASGSAFMSRG